MSVLGDEELGCDGRKVCQRGSECLVVETGRNRKLAGHLDLFFHQVMFGLQYQNTRFRLSTTTSFD